MLNLDDIARLPLYEQQEILRLVSAYEKSNTKVKAREKFVDFVRYVYPGGTISAHHKIIGDIFDKVVTGEKKRVILNMPPRVGKSLLSSLYLPAFFLGKCPGQHVIQATHTAEFSLKWAKDVRDLIQTPLYLDIFPDVKLNPAQKAAGFWKTTDGAEYFAVGTEGNVAGRNSKLFIIDDPVSEQDGKIAAFKPEVFDKVYDWYLQGPRQRMEPDSRMIIIMTRWGERDLTGRIKKNMGKAGVEKFEIIEFPAIFPDEAHCIFPELRPMDYWLGLKSEMPLNLWNCIYQQNPTSDEAALVKREWWQPWPDGQPLPHCSYIINSWDTAYKKTETSDFCACTTWGIFEKEGEYGIILLESFFERMAFPDLKRKAIQIFKDTKADQILVEEKAAGSPLLDELRQTRLPVLAFIPSRGNDKIVRVNSVSDLFMSRCIWFAQSDSTKDRKNEHTIEQLAAFPNGENDDLVDTTTQALIRFRRGGFVKTETDDNDDEELENKRIRKAKYY
jgi:predicted phage terminase large subunit-like protein